MPESKRPPGRPKGGSAFSRSDIVEAALDAIASGGYPALTIRGVARSIGASHATVQRHFATKDELWRGAVDSMFDRFELPTGPSSRDAPRDGITNLLGSGSAHPGVITAWLTDRSPGHRARFDYIAERLAERHEVVHSMIVDMQAAGEARSFDASALLLLINVGIGAIASAPTATREIYGFDLDDSSDRRRLAGALADILTVGVGRR